MTYRNDLEQAHEKIGRLEAELAEERSAKGKPLVRERPRKLLTVALLTAIAAIAAATYWLKRPSPQPVLLVPVDEAMNHLDRYQDRVLRVQGELVPRTAERVETVGKGCSTRMVIERHGIRMAIVYAKCVLPETVRIDSAVPLIAEGVLTSSGVLQAHTLLTQPEL